MNKKEAQNLLDCVIFLKGARDALKEIENLDFIYKTALKRMLEILIDEVEEKAVIY